MKNRLFLYLCLLFGTHASFGMIEHVGLNHISIVKFNLALGVDVNAKSNTTKKSCLQIAVIEGYVDMVQLLLSVPGIDVDYYVKDIDPATALHLAVYNSHNKSHRDIMRLLIAHPSTNSNLSVDTYHNTPLHVACIHDKEEAVEELLDHPKINPNAPNKHGKTPLHCASEEGLLNIVRLLLDHKDTNVNAQDNDEQTALHKASKRGDEAMVTFLLEHGADPILTDKNGITAIQIACQEGHESIVSVLLKKNPSLIHTCTKNKENLLHIVCRNTPLLFTRYIAQLLLTHLSTLADAQNLSGNIPLHYICSRNDENCVRLLLKANDKNIDVKNHEFGNTSLHRACIHPSSETIPNLLVKSGASTVIKNNKQQTPLAAMYFEFNHLDNLDPVTLEQMVRGTDEYGNTQLHLYTAGHVESDRYLQLLITQGLNVWSRNSSGETATDLACNKYSQLYCNYLPEKNSLMKPILDTQEGIMHSFLRVTSRNIQCSVFKQMFKECNIPEEVRKQIMINYYKINSPTIIARTYKNDKKYYGSCIEYKNTLHQALIDKPENPHLLWRDAK